MLGVGKRLEKQLAEQQGKVAEGQRQREVLQASHNQAQANIAKLLRDKQGEPGRLKHSLEEGMALGRHECAEEVMRLTKRCVAASA